MLFQSYLIKTINNRFGLNIDSGFDFDFDRNKWDCLCLVTQDIDQLNEFVYKNNIQLRLNKHKLIYFEPSCQWSYILLPKTKIHWEYRCNQVSLGDTIYNVLYGSWDQGYFCPAINGVKIKAVNIDQGKNCVLIPFKTYQCTEFNKDPYKLSVAGQEFNCVYPIEHYSINFNRRGIYINRKNRDKINLVELPEEFTIIEPEHIMICDGEFKKKINFIDL